MKRIDLFSCVTRVPASNIYPATGTMLVNDGIQPRDERFIRHGLCPNCGRDLQVVGDDNHTDIVCISCKITWAYVEEST